MSPRLTTNMLGQTRRLGLVGGMSWRSTSLYYERINTVLERRLGAHHSFRGHVWNLDYAELLAAASDRQWAKVQQSIIDAARGLDRAGCDIVVLTAVTAHRFFDAVAGEVKLIPHVLDGSRRRLARSEIRRAGVLGTSVTWNSDFVRLRLGGGGCDLLFLDDPAQGEIDDLIQNVLTVGGATEAGRATLLRAIRMFEARGAGAVVLACTELPLLLPIPATGIPLIDCVSLHVDEICSLLLGEDNAA